jgi:3',5'-cyclic AMP phosphodiesterase CpdA
MFTIAHVTDTHFGVRPGVAERSRRVVEAVSRLAPDVVIVTGDVADHGTTEEYAEAREVLGALSRPVLWCPGNHDVREEFSSALYGSPAGRALDVAVEVGAFRFLMLDSLVPAVGGQRIDHGELSEATLHWLDAQLSASGLPTFVCLHHPPVAMGIDWMDAIRLRDAERLEAVLARHAHVLATLVGHLHSAAASTFAGRPLLVGGGIASTATLPREGLPDLWYDVAPSYALHLVTDDLRLVTHWRSV